IMRLTMSRWIFGKEATRPLRRILRFGHWLGRGLALMSAAACDEEIGGTTRDVLQVEGCRLQVSPWLGCSRATSTGCSWLRCARCLILFLLIDVVVDWLSFG
ncbi:MAG: hypothetical protein QOJ40_2894, partial [Verrucomicrobiota bacterium]